MRQPSLIVTLAMLASCSTLAGPIPPLPEPGRAADARSPPAIASLPSADNRPVASPKAAGPIPAEFRHVWAIDAADCEGEHGLTRIAISSGAVNVHEGRAEVVSLEETATDGLIMQVKLVAEGKSEVQVHHLKLSRAGTTLSYDRGGTSFAYTRCD